jgi:hypothetical protein
MTLLPEVSFRPVTARAGLMNINFARTRPGLRPASKRGQISALAHISVMVATCTARDMPEGWAETRQIGHQPGSLR